MAEDQKHSQLTENEQLMTLEDLETEWEADQSHVHSPAWEESQKSEQDQMTSSPMAASSTSSTCIYSDGDSSLDEWEADQSHVHSPAWEESQKSEQDQMLSSPMAGNSTSSDSDSDSEDEGLKKLVEAQRGILKMLQENAEERAALEFMFEDCMKKLETYQ